MKHAKFRLPKIEQVKFSIKCLDEHIPVRESFATGNHEDDKRIEDDIIEKLEYTPWAWCCVEVAAEYKGQTGVDYLSCCSYDSEKDFIENSAYYEDMKQQAFDHLVSRLKSLND